MKIVATGGKIENSILLQALDTHKKSVILIKIS